MAKRIRGQRSTRHTGGQGPSRRGQDEQTTAAPQAGSASLGRSGSTSTTTPTAATSAAGATTATAAGPTAPRTTAATSSRATTPASGRAPRAGIRVRSDSLTAREAAEQTYVTEDLRRIGMVCALLAGILVLIWILLVPLDLLGLY